LAIQIRAPAAINASTIEPRAVAEASREPASHALADLDELLCHMATPLKHRSVSNTGAVRAARSTGTYRFKGQPATSLSRAAGSSGDGTLAGDACQASGLTGSGDHANLGARPMHGEHTACSAARHRHRQHDGVTCVIGFSAGHRVWSGWPVAHAAAVPDSRCERKRGEDLGHRDLTALAVGDSGGRAGAR